MTATDLLARLQSSGVSISTHGDRLAIDAPKGALTDALLSELRTHKAALMGLLVANAAAFADPGSVADLLADWGERAAMMEYEGGLSRADAEREAWQLAVNGKLTLH